MRFLEVSVSNTSGAGMPSLDSNSYTTASFFGFQSPAIGLKTRNTMSPLRECTMKTGLATPCRAGVIFSAQYFGSYELMTLRSCALVIFIAPFSMSLSTRFAFINCVLSTFRTFSPVFCSPHFFLYQQSSDCGENIDFVGVKEYAAYSITPICLYRKKCSLRQGMMA